jgi:soluble cytochrome b562
MIRTNAQYDPVTQNAKELIDTMIAEKLPRGITVKGKLDIFTAKESTQQVKPEESKIRSNKDILLSLRSALDNMTEGTLVNSPEFKKILDGLEEGAENTDKAKLTQIDYSEYEDGIYEDEDGEKVRIRKGKVVQ